MEFANETVIKGYITFKKETDDLTALQVRTIIGKHSNYPSVLLFGKTREKAKALKKGDYVTVVGKIESKRTVNPDNPNKYHYSQCFVAQDIIVDKPNEREFKNSVLISGSVNYIRRINDGVYTVSVYTITNRKQDNILIAAYGNNIKAIKNLEKGDQLKIAGTIQTSISKPDKNQVTKKRDTVVIDQVLSE